MIVDTETLAQVEVSAGLPNGAFYPAVSADGSTVVFQDWAGPLYAVDADGSNLRLLGGGPPVLCGADESSLTADGGSVVNLGAPCGSGKHDVYRFPTDGAAGTRLTLNTGRTLNRPRFSRDGGKISVEDLDGPFLAMDGDGRNVIQLSPPGLYVAFYGEEREFSGINGDGTLATFAWHGIFIVRTDGTGLRRIPNGNNVPEVAIDDRGDIVAHIDIVNGSRVVVVTGVPGITPPETDLLRFDADTETLTWFSSPSANAHNLYRSDLSGLASGDSGSCLQSSPT